jgi:hypothetical protein
MPEAVYLGVKDVNQLRRVDRLEKVEVKTLADGTVGSFGMARNGHEQWLLGKFVAQLLGKPEPVHFREAEVH